MAVIARSDSVPLLSAIRELAEYLHEDPVATAFNVGNAFFREAEEWHLRDPKTTEAIFDFYQTSLGQVHQLVFANYGIPNQFERIVRADSVFSGCTNILDLGAGIGSTLLATSCEKKTHADVGGVMLDYARWRYQRAGIRVLEVVLPPDYLLSNPFTERFDGVVCTEVIEHLPDPEMLVSLLSKVVEPGGKLLATVSFDDGEGMVPQHLNVDKWTDEGFVSAVFPKYGFRQLSPDVYIRA